MADCTHDEIYLHRDGYHVCSYCNERFVPASKLDALHRMMRDADYEGELWDAVQNYLATLPETPKP
jgi:hypothetical protein